MRKLGSGGVIAVAMRWASRLRFPVLFALTAALFILNVLIPDTLPLADELLLGLGVLMLGKLKKQPPEEET